MRRVRRIARQLGFVGRVRYVHVSGAGGAQYGLGLSAEQDVLLVNAEAFRCDADPEEFSLEAIIAHERGHQIVCRDARLQRTLAARLSLVSEEILASVVGSLIVTKREDKESLQAKAVHEALRCGIPDDRAGRLVTQLRTDLEEML